MNKLTSEHLILLNEKVAKKTGKSAGVKDMSALKRVIEKPYQKNEQFFYLHKDTVSKATVLGCEIAKQQVFENNNDMTALLAVLTLLELNGRKLINYQDDLRGLLKSLHEDNSEQVRGWIVSHLRPSKYVAVH